MITIQNISKKFEEVSGDIWATKDISFNIKKGEFVSIVGRSGSGKTTLLKIMGGLLQPSAGKVLISGKDIYSMSEEEISDYRCNSIGFVFQDFFLEEKYTVYQNLEIVLMISKIPYKKREKMIDEALLAVGMSHKKNTLVDVLSGGEKQRVCIARAIINNPDIIFADEPCGNLNYENGLNIMSLLRKQKESGKTVVLITHSTEDAKTTDRIITLKDGSVLKDEENR